MSTTMHQTIRIIMFRIRIITLNNSKVQANRTLQTITKTTTRIINNKIVINNGSIIIAQKIVIVLIIKNV